MQYLENILEITYVDLICNTLVWVLTNIHSSDIRSIRFKHTRIIRFFGL